jgi:hypothetical protein
MLIPVPLMQLQHATVAGSVTEFDTTLPPERYQLALCRILNFESIGTVHVSSMEKLPRALHLVRLLLGNMLAYWQAWHITVIWAKPGISLELLRFGPI